MIIKMGPSELYAPDGAPAGAADGSEVQTGKPEGENAGKGATPAWMAQLPGDLKTNEQLSKYATLGDAVKALMAAGEQQDQPEEKQQEKVGPVKYENFAKKLEFDDDPLGEIGSGLAGCLEAKGISQKDAEDIFDAFSGSLKTAKGNLMSKGRELCEQAVKAQWGKEYDTGRALMAKGYQALGDTDGSLQKALDNCGASFAPAVWELLRRVGALVSEDDGTPFQGTGAARKQNPDGVPVDYSKPYTQENE